MLFFTRILEKTANSRFQGPKQIYLHFIERQSRYTGTKMAVVSLKMNPSYTTFWVDATTFSWNGGAKFAHHLCFASY